MSPKKTSQAFAALQKLRELTNPQTSQRAQATRFGFAFLLAGWIATKSLTLTPPFTPFFLSGYAALGFLLLAICSFGGFGFLKKACQLKKEEKPTEETKTLGGRARRAGILALQGLLGLASLLLLATSLYKLLIALSILLWIDFEQKLSTPSVRAIPALLAQFALFGTCLFWLLYPQNGQKFPKLRLGLLFGLCPFLILTPSFFLVPPYLKTLQTPLQTKKKTQQSQPRYTTLPIPEIHQTLTLPQDWIVSKPSHNQIRLSKPRPSHHKLPDPFICITWINSTTFQGETDPNILLPFLLGKRLKALEASEGDSFHLLNPPIKHASAPIIQAKVSYEGTLHTLLTFFQPSQSLFVEVEIATHSIEKIETEEEIATILRSFKIPKPPPKTP